MKLTDLKIKIFADTADLGEMAKLANLPYIKGFTTNPTLMRKAHVTSYESWAKRAVNEFGEYPISFEVIADDFDEIERQASKIASWGDNVYVKIPITDTKGHSTAALISRLSKRDIKVNVTAVMTSSQAAIAAEALCCDVPAIISVFAGRIDDTFKSAVVVIHDAKVVCYSKPYIEVLWASTREVASIWNAEQARANIITISPEILDKLSMIGKDLDVYSLETVKQFYDDAIAAGYTL